MKKFDLIDYFRNKGLISWLPQYMLNEFFNSKKSKKNDNEPIHIIFSVADHFEPFHGGVDLKNAEARVKAWVEEYPKIADRHKDSDGRKPQHTWFYPPHNDLRFLKDLTDLCNKGYGEIEMHLHHNRMDPFPDNSQTLRKKILKCIEDYARYGIFCLPDGTKKFAFVHGDWSLDNSRGKEICGVNDEITILKECGCFADFTFPSLGDAQPSMINKMFYCKDITDKPKSYNKGKEVKVDGKTWGDLLIVSGIIGLRWKSRIHAIKPSIEASNLDYSDKPFDARIDYLIENAVTIQGRPEWKFIKLHTHGAKEQSWDSLFGDSAEKMYNYLNKNYNDGEKYMLHYATAREMYNIIKAAEAGQKGNPGLYRDFEIPPYVYVNNCVKENK